MILISPVTTVCRCFIDEEQSVNESILLKSRFSSPPFSIKTSGCCCCWLLFNEIADVEVLEKTLDRICSRSFKRSSLPYKSVTYIFFWNRNVRCNYNLIGWNHFEENFWEGRKIIIIIKDLQVRRHIHASMNRSYLQFIFLQKTFLRYRIGLNRVNQYRHFKGLGIVFVKEGRVVH